MNKQIKELFEQAKAESSQWLGSKPAIAMTYDGLERFAELLILECAALAKSKSEHIEGIKTEDQDDQMHLLSLAWRFKEFGYEIKKHFGVEE